jgi:hypothetical protein
MNFEHKNFTTRLAGALVAAAACVLCFTACRTVVSEDRALKTEIVTEPPGARIEINWKYIGNTPVKYAFQQDISGNVIGNYQILATPVDPTLLAESDWLGANVRVPPKMILRLKSAASFVPSNAFPRASTVPSDASPNDADIGSIPPSSKSLTKKQAFTSLAPTDLRPAEAAKTLEAGNFVAGSGHWIDEVMDDGNLIKLEDDSLWRVSPIDAIDSALWLPVTDITVIESDDPAYPYKLVNKDDNEVVNARPIK